MQKWYCEVHFQFGNKSLSDLNLEFCCHWSFLYIRERFIRVGRCSYSGCYGVTDHITKNTGWCTQYVVQNKWRQTTQNRWEQKRDTQFQSKYKCPTWRGYKSKRKNKQQKKTVKTTTLYSEIGKIKQKKPGEIYNKVK